MNFKLIATLLISFCTLNEAVVRLLYGGKRFFFIQLSNDLNILFSTETHKDCSTGGKAKYIDYSGLKYEIVNDFNMFLMGENF
jgi:hypothetical protein